MLFLSRNRSVEKIIFVEKNYEKAKVLADSLNASYTLRYKTAGYVPSDSTERSVFISYSDKYDRFAAEEICRQLKLREIPYWFAPENISIGDYASEIVRGIRKCTHFICLISENSMRSPHILNELDLAFQRISQGVSIIPFRLDDSALEPAFMYYLSRMQWKTAFLPPLADRIKDLVGDIL